MSNGMAGGEEKSSYSYSDVASSSGGNQTLHHSHMLSQLHSFDPNPEIYNLTAGMEMIGFPTKNLQPQVNTESTSLLWKGFFNSSHLTAALPNGAAAAGPSSSSKEMNEPTASSDHHFYQQDANESLMMVSQDSSSSAPWSTQPHPHSGRLLVDDPSLRCVFPSDENGRPSQGLSLSLNSSNPSSIGLQTFEIRQPDDLRFGPSSSRSVNIPHHSQLIQEHSFVRNSKYLGPAQELLNEFCNLGPKQAGGNNSSKQKVQKISDCQDENVIKKQSLYSLDFLELQIRKTRLLHMLEEVDRRYKHYCDQMKAVVSSFEAVAGNGAASVYSALASKAMSGHFRCLKDGIVAQIKATKKAMGQKDVAAAPGAMRGETPRLKLIDQTLRQQRALQQMSLMESHPWRPQRGLPERSVSILRAWLFEHFLHPYPSDVDKHILARQTGLSRSQVSNWFINARVRLWKPMVEEMYLEEVKDDEGMGGALDSSNLAAENNAVQNPSFRNDDQKPSHDQLIRIDSDCLSSIIHNPEHASRKDKFKSIIQNEPHDKNPNFGRLGDSSSIGMELDFSSYNHHSSTAAYGGGVSLTLGLHQHGPSGGLTLGFSPATQNHSSLFYPRDHLEAECQTVQYSLLDSEGQNLQPYRNLMGAQLLHDLAG